MSSSVLTPAPSSAEFAGSPWPVFWIASVAVFLVSLDATLLYAAFRLRAGFPQASAADMSWVLNGYTVVYAAMLIPSGGLADAYGRKRMFLTGVALFLAASAACGLAGGVGWLVAARVAQAVGAAFADAGVAVHRAGRLSGRAAHRGREPVGRGGGAGGGGRPSLGAFVVDAAGWPWAYINVPLGALSLWRGARLLQESVRPESRRRLDGVGMALLILGVGAVALAIVQSESPAWSAGELWVAAAAVGAGAGRLRGLGRVAPQPLVDLALFQHRSYRYANLATLSFGIAFAMMFFAFFFYMMGVWHYSLPKAGLAVTPGPLLVMPTAIVTGRLAARMGHRPFLVGALLYAVAGLWFLLVPGAALTIWAPGCRAWC